MLYRLVVLILASGAWAQSGPCANCRLLVPDAYDGEPTPLLVALHGDEGSSEHIYSAYRRHVEAAGWLMVSLECPRDRGCWTGSWYEWEATAAHDWAWVGEQVDAVAADYAVDPRRVYLTGWSGGAQYLGRYAVRFADRYAGVAYIGGGAPSRRAECPACEIPAYFLIGSRDFLLDAAERMESFLNGCGHEVEFDLRQGRPHGDIWEMVNEGGGRLILDWFDARPNGCLGPPEDHPDARLGDEPWVDEPPPEPPAEEEPAPPSAPEAPPAPLAAPDPPPPEQRPDAASEPPPEAVPPLEWGDVVHPRAEVGDDAGGCGAVPGAGTCWLLLAPALALARRRGAREARS